MTFSNMEEVKRIYRLLLRCSGHRAWIGEHYNNQYIIDIARVGERYPSYAMFLKY